MAWRLVLAAFCAATVGPWARAQVVISEIMYNPDGPEESREWVELYNPTSRAVDLSGWRLADAQDGQLASPLPTGTTLGPGEALVVTGDAALFDAQWNRSGTVRRYEVTDMPPFANSPSATNETVAIQDAFGQYVDMVNYDDEDPWPRDSPDGASIMLLPHGLSASGNDVATNWKPSMAGVYGATFEYGPGGAQDRASPGFVETVSQTHFAPSPDAAWSMVVLPDTQAYTKSSVDTAVFNQMIDWVVDHRDEYGVQFVMHEGDIVNQNSQVTPTSGDQSGTEQWQNAKVAMSRLDGVVPYGMAPGNHDYGTTNAQDRSTQYNDFFKASDNPLVDPARGGTLKSVMTFGELDNSIHTFAAPDGREMLVLTTEWGPRQQAVDWANRGMRQYPDHTAVLVTHAYMGNDELRLDHNRSSGGNPHSYPTADDTHDGEELWNELVSPNGAFEMVFSGHIGGDGTGYLRSTGEQGQTVHQMLFDTQFEVYGGNGWIRVLEFLEDGRSVRVRTYSPLHDLEKTDAANLFEFTISPLLPGDYNDDGVVDAADYAVWRDGVGRRVDPWSAADGDGDGLIGDGDYVVWRDAYGSSRESLVAGQSIPEPAAVWMAVLGAFPAVRGPRRTAG